MPIESACGRTEHNVTLSPLLSLPGEIKNKIYPLTVGGNHLCYMRAGTCLSMPHRDEDDADGGGTFIEFDAANNPPSSGGGSSPTTRYEFRAQTLRWRNQGHRHNHDFSFLQTCKTVAEEAMPFFYSHNMFEVAPDTATLDMLQDRYLNRPGRYLPIGALKIDLRNFELEAVSEAWLERLRSIRGVETLVVELDCESLRGYDPGAERFVPYHVIRIPPQWRYSPAELRETLLAVLRLPAKTIQLSFSRNAGLDPLLRRGREAGWIDHVVEQALLELKQQLNVEVKSDGEPSISSA